MLAGLRISGASCMRQVRCWSVFPSPDVATAPRSQSVQRFHSTNYFNNFGKDSGEIRLRPGTTTPSGAILPEPERTPFGLLSVVTAVITGLFIGATLSKWMANFLEEKELFVPSDDDDDDDDDD